MSKPDGGPAFPVTHPLLELGENMPRNLTTGMTLRDYFAAAALNGFMSNNELLGTGAKEAMVVEQAYSIADSMLAERTKP